MVIDLAIAGLALVGSLRGQDDEAGGVVDLVLDVLDEDVETVELGGEARREGSLGRVAALARPRARAGRVARDARLQPVLADDLAALAEGVDVAVDASDVFELRALDRHELEVDRQEVLADDVQARVGRRWWMSATRPASEFSIGIMARSARPSKTAAKQSSKVAQGMASALGKISRLAMCELAPGSPWKAIFLFWAWAW